MAALRIFRFDCALFPSTLRMLSAQVMDDDTEAERTLQTIAQATSTQEGKRVSCVDRFSPHFLAPL